MELRAVLSKIEAKDAGGDFALQNCVQEEGSLPDPGNRRESQAEDPTRYE